MKMEAARSSETLEPT